MEDGCQKALCEIESRSPTIVERLQSERRKAEEKIVKMNKLEKLFDSNPDLREALQIISELGLRY